MSKRAVVVEESVLVRVDVTASRTDLTDEARPFDIITTDDGPAQNVSVASLTAEEAANLRDDLAAAISLYEEVRP